MTTVTYGMHPPPASPDFASAVRYQLSPTEGTKITVGASEELVNVGQTRMLGFIFPFITRRGAVMRMDLGLVQGTSIPAGAVLTDAYLRLRAQVAGIADQAAFTDVKCALAAKDGVWDPVGGLGDFWGPQATDVDMRVDVYEVGPTLRWQTGVAVLDQSVRIRGRSAPNSSRQQIAQVMTDAAGISALGRVDVGGLRRIGTQPGRSVWVDVYEVAAGEIDEVTGVVATSDAVSFDSLPTVASLVSFAFSGADQIAVPGSSVRAFALRTDAPDNGANNVEVQVGNSAQYLGGSICFGGIREAFSDPNYPESGMLPLIWEGDGSTIRVAPHGTIANIPAFPPFTAVGTYFEVRPTNFHTLIQEWVDAPGYVPGEPLAVLIQPDVATSFAGGPRRAWDDAELVVEFEVGTPVPPVNFDVAVSSPDLAVAVPAAVGVLAVPAADLPIAVPSPNIVVEAATMAALLNLCPVDVNLCVSRGDTRPFTLTLQLAGAGIDVTGSSFLLTVDPSPIPTDALNNLFQLTGTITDALNGVVQFSMTPAQADQLGVFFFDVQWTDVAGAITTVAKGEIEFRQDITK